MSGSAYPFSGKLRSPYRGYWLEKIRKTEKIKKNYPTMGLVEAKIFCYHRARSVFLIMTTFNNTERSRRRGAAGSLCVMAYMAGKSSYSTEKFLKQACFYASTGDTCKKNIPRGRLVSWNIFG
jgi:hypothetical protein